MCGIALVISPHGLHTETIQDVIEAPLTRRGPDCYGRHDLSLNGHVVSFAASLLQLRGTNRSTVPIRSSSSDDVLLFNGEIFEGLEMEEGENDGQALLRALESSSSSSEEGPVGVLSRLRGPWSIVYWHSASSKVWIGRDFMGRRSLLVHWPSASDGTEEGILDEMWVISSVAVPLRREGPDHIDEQGGRAIGGRAIGGRVDETGNASEATRGRDEDRDEEGEEDENQSGGWQEMEPGIYSFYLHPSTSQLEAPSLSLPHSLEDLKRHPWEDTTTSDLHSYERSQEGKPSSSSSGGERSSDVDDAARELLELLKKSVDVQCRSIELSYAPRPPLPSCAVEVDASVMVLFSGGVDSVIVAALAHLSLPPQLPIDLCNVCFDGGKSPDRLSALAALDELSSWAPERDWRLILVNSSLQDLDDNKEHLLSLLHPAGTVMDLNIGCALWLAAGGEGVLVRSTTQKITQAEASHHHSDGPLIYCSRARVVLVGHGADEQCAGYGRHRTHFRSGGLEGLSKELKLDVRRMWRRNCGRDDRLIADRSREARHPFLDEKVMEFILHQPLSRITDLREPLGVGDKKILRRVLSILGLDESGKRIKRAIQFGSRIGKQANRRDFGSNRAANKKNVGGMMIDKVVPIASNQKE